MLEPSLISSALCLGFIAVGWDYADFSGAQHKKGLNGQKETARSEIVAVSTKALPASGQMKGAGCSNPSVLRDVEPLSAAGAGRQSQSQEMMLTQESREP